MKKVLIYLIRAYQIIPFRSHNMCRFTPSCSEYMIESIERFGTYKGLKIGFKRLLRCHPHGKYGYDPVCKKEEV